jgi:hypothetical protein
MQAAIDLAGFLALAELCPCRNRREKSRFRVCAKRRIPE